MRANTQRSALSVHVLSVVVSDVVIVVVPAIAITAATAVVVIVIVVAKRKEKTRKLGEHRIAMLTQTRKAKVDTTRCISPSKRMSLLSGGTGHRQIAHTGAHGRDAEIYCLVHGITPCTASVALLS